MRLRTDQKRKLHGLRGKIEPWLVTEAMQVFDAMVKAKGDKHQAAALLGIGKTTLYHKIEAYGLRRRIDQAVAKFV